MNINHNKNWLDPDEVAEIKPGELWENKKKDSSRKPEMAAGTPQGVYKRMRGFGG